MSRALLARLARLEGGSSDPVGLVVIKANPDDVDGKLQMATMIRSGVALASDTFVVMRGVRPGFAPYRVRNGEMRKLVEGRL